MMSFRDVLKSVDEYERNIIKLIDNDCVNIVHGYNYSLANSDKRELYARYKVYTWYPSYGTLVNKYDGKYKDEVF